jgi:hypothetical protein
MEFGAFFILVIVLVVVAVPGGDLYALALWLRVKDVEAVEDGVGCPREDRPRPEHVELENEQRARFVGAR